MTSDMIVEAIRSVGAGAVNGYALATGAAADQPSPEAVARFDEAMMDDSVGNVQDAAQVAFVPRAGNVPKSEPVGGIPLAGQVSEAWGTAQVDHQELLHRVRALADLGARRALSVSELSELQYDIATLSFQQEVVAKVADKASNAIQTLIKNQ